MYEGDYLEVKLLNDVKRLDCAIPTQVTTLILSGFGVIKAIGLLHVLLDGQIKLIENATWYAQRQIDPDFGRRKDLIDERNIRFDCVSEYDYEEPCGINSTESWDESENIVKEKVKELLKIEEDLNIERAHRVGKYQKAYTKSDGTRVPEKVRPIVARFSSWKQKDAIVKAARSLKPTGVMFLDDLSDLTLAKRKAQIRQLLEARKEGKIAYFSVDKLIIKERLTGFGQPHSPFAGSEEDEVIINRHDE